MCLFSQEGNTKLPLTLWMTGPHTHAMSAFSSVKATSIMWLILTTQIQLPSVLKLKNVTIDNLDSLPFNELTNQVIYNYIMGSYKAEGLGWSL